MNTNALPTLPATMPCPCGAEVPMIDGAYADGSGLYCSAAHLSAYGEEAQAPLLADIEPIVMRNPFATGALLPEQVETKNSTYEIREHVLMVGQPATCTVTCVRGTFAGQGWTVPVSDVCLTRVGLFIYGSVGLRSTEPLSVNGYPVSTWA